MYHFFTIIKMKLSFIFPRSHLLSSGPKHAQNAGLFSCSERHFFRDNYLQVVSSTRPCVSRLMLFDASSCPAATFTEASKPKSSWNHAPNSRGGSVSRVHVSAACIARSLLQHAAFALRLLLQGDVLNLWRVTWTLRCHPCNLHGRGSGCGDLKHQQQYFILTNSY